MACCSSATWHVALMPVPPDGCDDSGVFLCGARLHAERFLTGDSTTTMLLLPSAARGTHAGASRRLRRQRRLRLWGSASCRAAFDRGSTTCCSLRPAVLLLLRNFSATSSVWSLELHFRTSRRCDYCTFRRSTLDTGWSVNKAINNEFNRQPSWPVFAFGSYTIWSFFVRSALCYFVLSALPIGTVGHVPLVLLALCQNYASYYLMAGNYGCYIVYIIMGPQLT